MASDLQWREGVEGELGLVLVHVETLEVRQLVCRCKHRTGAHVSLLIPPSSVLNWEPELTLQKTVRRRRVSCGGVMMMMMKNITNVGYIPFLCDYLWLSPLWQTSSQPILLH